MAGLVRYGVNGYGLVEDLEGVESLPVLSLLAPLNDAPSRQRELLAAVCFSEKLAELRLCSSREDVMTRAILAFTLLLAF